MTALFTPLILTLFSGILFAQDAVVEPRPGFAVAKVAVKDDKEQSYAVYLPSGYTRDRKWPTIFCFDPRARGNFALEHFRAAAEKYGFIVVCSNNSRNGLDAETMTKIVAAFDRDAHERFSIDEKRTYAAGFSGGARLAIGLALRCKICLAGVIAVGAGFPGDVQPSAEIPFAFFGAAGFDDFNFTELRELGKKFEGLPVNYRFETFPGGHEWMNAATADKALAWLELQAMKTGSLTRNDKFVREQFVLRNGEAAALKSEKHFIDAYLAYSSLARDLEGMLDVTAVRTLAEELKNSTDHKKAARVESDLAEKQTKTTSEVFSLWAKTSDPGSDEPDPKQTARRKLEDLRKRRDDATDSAERRLARRTLFGVFVRAIETGGAQIRDKNYPAAATQFELARATEPRDWGAAFQLARAYALDKKKKQALQALEDAVNLGFKNFEALKTDEAFTSFSGEPRFLKLFN